MSPGVVTGLVQAIVQLVVRLRVSPHVGGGLDVDARLCRFLLRVCKTSPRPISTGRLGIAAVHLRPINPVFCWGPYPLEGVGNLILKRASRLDAFSGYHFRT